jgi:hypothetical protein
LIVRTPIIFIVGCADRLFVIPEVPLLFLLLGHPLLVSAAFFIFIVALMLM